MDKKNLENEFKDAFTSKGIASSRTIGLSLMTMGFITFIVLLVLKLTGAVAIGWFWVWFPLWIVPVCEIVLIIVAIVVCLILCLIITAILVNDDENIEFDEDKDLDDSNEFNENNDTQSENSSEDEYKIEE